LEPLRLAISIVALVVSAISACLVGVVAWTIGQRRGPGAGSQVNSCPGVTAAATTTDRGQATTEARPGATATTHDHCVPLEEPRIALEALPYGALLLDHSGRIRLANRAARVLLGIDGEEDLRERPLQQVMRVAAGEWWHAFGLADSSGSAEWPTVGAQPVQRRNELTRADGSRVPVDQSVATVWLEGEELLLVTLTDISDQRNTEFVLQQAKDEAEAANRLKSDFLANVSHEIRTPLNGIIGFSEIILSADSVDTCHRLTHIILRESGHLLNLINDLLDHAKIEAGRLELDPRPIDLPQLLQRVVSSAHVQARGKGLDFRVSLDPNVPRYVVGDALRIHQVLRNLVANAVKFTNKGFVNVLVEALDIVGEEVQIRFSVVDTGIGIPEEKRKAIFDSFTQADGSTTRQYGGTGLGTAIAKRLVGMMGGEIGVDSTPGEGSIFWFTMRVPITNETPQADIAPEMNGSNERFDRRRRRSGRILVAEDYPTNQEVVRNYLETAGHQVTLVDNGRKAVEACQQQIFDLVLLDVQMPEMDGFAATTRIRDLGPVYEKVPLLGLTAHASAAAKTSCREAGMDDVIIKPIRRDAFLSAVAHWLDVAAADVPLEAFQPEHLEEQRQRLSTSRQPEVVPPIDLDRAEYEFGGNRALLGKVVAQFLVDLENQIDKLGQALDLDDTETLRAEAHRIRGGASNLTADRLADAADRLEVAATDRNPAQAADAFEQLENETSRLKQFVADNGQLELPTCH